MAMERDQGFNRCGAQKDQDQARLLDQDLELGRS